jgi:AcrR family transcriptional regulator
VNGHSVNRSPRRPAEREARRASILRAAEEVFATRGYHAASVADIARRSGFAAGTIYLYFGDKADLYGSIILEKMRAMTARLDAALNSHPSATESLRAGVLAFFSFHEENRRFFEIYLHQHQMESSPLHAAHWKEMEALKRSLLDALATCVARGQKQREIRAGDARRYAVALLGIILQMIRQWMRDEWPGDLAAQADFVADCFLHGAASPAPSAPRSRTGKSS